MRGHCGVPCDSACGRTAADATLPAADASTTPTTPGRNAWARAPMNIQPRAARENRTADGVISPELRTLTGFNVTLLTDCAQPAQLSEHSFVFAGTARTAERNNRLRTKDCSTYDRDLSRNRRAAPLPRAPRSGGAPGSTRRAPAPRYRRSVARATGRRGGEGDGGPSIRPCSAGVRRAGAYTPPLRDHPAHRSRPGGQADRSHVGRPAGRPVPRSPPRRPVTAAGDGERVDSLRTSQTPAISGEHCGWNHDD